MRILILSAALFLIATTTFANKNFRDTTLIKEEIFRPIIEEAFNSLDVPGAIVGIWKGDESYVTSIGLSDMSSGQSFTANDKVRIGSVTKTFTATVILQLQDEGKLSLSDKLSEYLPSFPNSDNITIKQIGSMTSGIFEYAKDEIFTEDFLENIDKAFTPVQLIDLAAKNPPYFPPGTGVYYSNTNFIILGMIVEKVTGNDVVSEIKRRILDPLGMSETSFATTMEIAKPHATGYMYVSDTASIPIDITKIDPNWAWAAGSMVSNLNDLYKYAKPLAVGSLISQHAQTVRLKWGPELLLPFGTWKDRTIRYGFGIENFGDALGHNGEIPGFNTFMVYMPDRDVTIIVLSNMQENKKDLSPADFIGRAILDKIKTM